MTRVRRKKYHYGDTHIRKKYKTKRRTKYMDEIHEDMKPENAEKLLHQKVDLDKPGSGQHYCLHCARYFTDVQSMKAHFRSKQHKRRLKALEEDVYTQQEAEAAAGLGTYKPPTKKGKVVTQEVGEDVSMEDKTD